METTDGKIQIRSKRRVLVYRVGSLSSGLCLRPLSNHCSCLTSRLKPLSGTSSVCFRGRELTIVQICPTSRDLREGGMRAVQRAISFELFLRPALRKERQKGPNFLHPLLISNGSVDWLPRFSLISKLAQSKIPLRYSAFSRVALSQSAQPRFWLNSKASSSSLLCLP